MKLLRARVLFCVCVAFATQAPGQTVSVWTGSAGDGQWATPGNWNPVGEPVSPNEANVTIAATIALPTTSIGSLFLQTSTINLNVSGATFTAEDISIDSGATVNLNIGAGSSIVSTNSAVSTFVGDGNGSGVLNLTNGGSLNFTSTSLGSGVGIGGTGVLNQSGSTTVNVTTAGQAGFFVIGADGNVSTPSSLPPNSQTALGGNGTYTISGAATLVADSVAIGLGSGLGGGNVTGGSTATTGLLNINGGTVTVTDLILGAGTPVSTDTVVNVSGAVNQTAGTALVSNLDIGVATGAVANYSLSGGTLTVSTDLNIGGSGATGTMTLSNSGALTDNGTLEVGTTGGTGTFTYAGGSLTTQGISVGAKGIFNQNASFTPTLISNPITLTNGTYNLNAGTISLGGNTGTATCAIQGTGTFNFAGGTVDTNSAWIDTLNGAFTGTSGINTAGGAATLSGTLTGTGTLDVTGGIAVSFTGIGNSGSWGIHIAGGSTVNATNLNSLSATGPVTIGSGSTFNLGSTGNAVDILQGTVSDFTDVAGLAQFNLTGFTNANTLVLGGRTNLSVDSATNIGAGTLVVTNGTISNVTGTNPTDTLEIGGSPPGTVKLLGFNSVPVVTVNGGSTLMAGNSTAGAFSITGNVNNLGTLGTLGTLNTPAPLLIGGSLTSTGTLLVNSNGLAVDTYGSAAHPLSSATLSGTVRLAGIGSVSDVPIVYTTGGVTATIGNAPGDLTTNPPTALFSATFAIQGTNLVLSTTQNFVTSFAQTSNEAAVGRSIDYLIAKGVPLPTGFVPVLTVLNTLTAAQIPVALEEYTPQSLQYARNIAFENSTFLAQRMNGIDANLRNGVGGLDTNAISIVAPGFDSGLGRSLGSMLAYNNPPYHTPGAIGNTFYPGDAPTGFSPYASTSSKRGVTASSESGESISDSPAHEAAAPTGHGEPDFSRVSEFIGGDVILADLNRSSSAANAPSSKANYTAGDATAGVSFRVTSHLQAGVLFDYNHTNAKTDSSGSRTVVNSYSPGVFATYSDHGFYANGLFSFGYNTYSNHRNIGFLNDTAASDPNGQQYVGDLDLGYDFHPDKAWIAGPIVGVTYTHLDIDSFTETGAPGANLSVQEQNVDSLRSRLGGHVIYQTRVGYVLLQPNLTATWQHEYLDNGTGITSSFSDFPTTPFTIQAASVSRDSALVGTGLTAAFDNALALSLNYTVDVNTGDYFAQTIMLGFNARF